MGSVYQGRKLCCDKCGKAGARRSKCPFGYCPSVAYCADCRKNPIVKFQSSKGYHREQLHCEKRHDAMIAEEQERQTLMARGEAVLAAAKNAEGGKVHVLFNKQDGSSVGFYMDASVYGTEGINRRNATPATFAKIGTITPAPANF